MKMTLIVFAVALSAVSTLSMAGAQTATNRVEKPSAQARQVRYAYRGISQDLADLKTQVQNLEQRVQRLEFPSFLNGTNGVIYCGATNASAR